MDWSDFKGAKVIETLLEPGEYELFIVGIYGNKVKSVNFDLRIE